MVKMFSIGWFRIFRKVQLSRRRARRTCCASRRPTRVETHTLEEMRNETHHETHHMTQSTPRPVFPERLDASPPHVPVVVRFRVVR